MKLHPVNTHQRHRRCTACERRRACHPGGICWVCHTRRQVGTVDPKRAPLEPTDAQPGSAAKVMMLARRAEAGVRLWHSEDYRPEE